MRLENDKPYIKYSQMNIEKIQSRLNQLEEKYWYIDTSRQLYNSGPHVKTTSLILQYCRGEPEIDDKFIKIFPQYKLGKIPINNTLYTYPTQNDFPKDIKEIKEIVIDRELNALTKSLVLDLEKQFDGISGLVIYTKLPQGKTIRTHADPGYYLSVVHRLHIPIFTNDKCIFKLGNHSINMTEGCLYEINNQLPHGVENMGNSDRVHLIIDIIPNKMLNNIN